MFFVGWEMQYHKSSHSYGQQVTGSFITTTYLLMHQVLCFFCVKYQTTQMTQPPYSPDWVPCDFWLFPKLKSPLKGKRFQTINEIQENRMGQLVGDSNKGFCRVYWTVEEMLGELCEIPRCLLWRGLRCHCLMSNVSCVLYLQYMSPFFISHGWTPPGQS